MKPKSCNVAAMGSAWGEQRDLKDVDKAVVKWWGKFPKLHGVVP